MLLRWFSVSVPVFVCVVETMQWWQLSVGKIQICTACSIMGTYWGRGFHMESSAQPFCAEYLPSFLRGFFASFALNHLAETTPTNACTSTWRENMLVADQGLSRGQLTQAHAHARTCHKCLSQLLPQDPPACSFETHNRHFLFHVILACLHHLMVQGPDTLQGA